MCPGNLARQLHVVISDVRFWIPRPVLELHFQTAAELFEIDLRPIDAELAANAIGRDGTYPLSFAFYGVCILTLHFTRLFGLVA